MGREFQTVVHFNAGQFLSALPSFPPPRILSHHLGGSQHLLSGVMKFYVKLQFLFSKL